MADPLSISAGVVDIIVPALHVSRLPLDGLQPIIDAPKAPRTLKLSGDGPSVTLSVVRFNRNSGLIGRTMMLDP
jgi:hypothetical protein